MVFKKIHFENLVKIQCWGLQRKKKDILKAAITWGKTESNKNSKHLFSWMHFLFTYFLCLTLNNLEGSGHVGVIDQLIFHITSLKDFSHFFFFLPDFN